ncbi:hypothetical protein ACELLULO517_08155 [Acidisoma cellulosilytica]|uniref:Uncharacterized protein n=1 Tax=Acidisoma cellulosilyticum TaxID=2802395 RepID=A0A964E389_9PROT|nr:hypothetical protein [Acidisoma cellulosilyticum]MCB8880201.1 hypothetical protein [Acidisoma cellulosilyticum]
MTEGPSAVLRALNVGVASLWVAVCAATPEFIWRGARVVASHLNAADLASALLVGLILAFCIEPALERFRHTAAQPPGPQSYNLVFRAAVGLAFAFASVCLHDAITAFLASHAADDAVRQAGLVAGLRLAGAWTVVPFCVALAWLTVGRARWRWVFAVLALASPGLAALMFSWQLQDWITAQLPASCILLLGYRQWSLGPVAGFFRRNVQVLLWVSPIWLIGALLFNWAGNQLGLAWTQLYTPGEAWIDVRFYLGWAIGLSLAPVPLAERACQAGIGK